jgi:far upstream element-binding protein
VHEQGIVGRIIGRGGETIRALQQASEAHIVVNQNFPDGEPRQVNISGRPEAVERAVNMVQELISGEPGSAQAIIQKVSPSRGVPAVQVVCNTHSAPAMPPGDVSNSSGVVHAP